MDVRVGVDLVPFARVGALLADGGPALARMLTARELELSHRAGAIDLPGVAGRLAAKEAVFKLLRAPGQTLPWLGIEVLRHEAGGWPVVRLGGRAARLADEAGIEHIDITITHDDPCAVAVALATGAAPPHPAAGAAATR